MQHWAQAFGPDGSAYAYCRETVSTAASFHARMFAPGMGLSEDPATGGAAAAFSAVVHRFDAPKEGINRLVIEQGFEMGRPSTIRLEIVVAASGQLKAARIGGHAVVVSEGVIEV